MFILLFVLIFFKLFLGFICCFVRKCSEYGNCGCSFGFYGDGFICIGNNLYL